MVEEKKGFFGRILDSLSGKDKQDAAQAEAAARARQEADLHNAQAQRDAKARADERLAAEKAEAERQQAERLEMEQAASRVATERQEAEARRLAARLAAQERVEAERTAEGRTAVGQAAAEELANRDATREGPGAEPAERKPALTPAETENVQPMPPGENPENLPEGEFGESVFPRHPTRGLVLVRSLHIRSDHSTEAESVAGLVDGQEVTIYDTWTDGKDTWVRLGDGQWAAAIYNGETYIQIDEK